MLDLKNKDNVSKSEMELVENEKQEYKILGRFMRRKGLMLFSYNILNDKLEVVEESKDEDLRIVLENGVLKPQYTSHTEATINSNNEHFEALNLKTAQKRVEKFKKGKIKNIDNLKIYNPKPILNF